MTGSQWASGYVSEIDYTLGYYRELCPGLMDFALAYRGLGGLPPRPLRYLELGFGQGLSINIHAAANAGDFWGTDFNPSHAARAKSLALACGSGAVLLDDSFAELSARPDLPEFDVIALHGIWSWISEENRRIIVDLIRRKLAVGGVVYLSYNCLPGWAPAIPLRHLMTLHAETAGSDAQGMLGRMDQAFSFTQQVIDSGAAYFRANPSVVERLKHIVAQNRQYLAHEYFTRDWHPMHFSAVAEMLSEAKLSYAAPAHLLDHIDMLNFSVEAKKLLDGIDHPVLKESVRDYVLNQQFRRDLFVKGARKLFPVERRERLLRQRFVLTVADRDVPGKVKVAVGEATLQEGIYGPIVEALAEDGRRAKSAGELARSPRLKHLQPSQIVDALAVLVGAGSVHPAQEGELAVKARTDALNAHLCNLARFGDEIGYLVSPLTGGGIAVPRIHQLFLLAMAEGRRGRAEWAKYAWEAFAAQGQRLIKEGRTLESAEDNLAELAAQAEEFEARRVPVLRSLMTC